MKKWFKNVSFVILLFKSCLFLSQDLGTKKVIVVDPGHGGNDSGAIGANGIEEKQVTLKITRLIAELSNKNNDQTVEIYQTRYSDTSISLRDRAKMAKALKADLFLSLHCNHSNNADARGVEVFVANSGSKFSDESVWLAFHLQDGLNRKLGFESRGVKFANFQVLRETIDVMPSVLVELGFLSNKDETDYFKADKNLLAIAFSILTELLSK